MMDNSSSSIKTYMAITAERDAAIRDRNMALEERKRAFAERDMAMLQRDAAIAERNSALKERDDAVAALQDTECSIHSLFSDSANDDEAKDLHYLEQIRYDIPDDGEFSPVETSTSHTPNAAEAEYESAKTNKVKREEYDAIANSSKSSKRQAEDVPEHMMPPSSNGWSSSHSLETDEERDGQIVAWKDDLALNQINFDETSMPVPVCSCTGTPQPCYKWGSGGWQSACCTTTMSMYPLPQVSNKRYTRVGGRKMSGSAFNKLLSRLVAEGKDLCSGPLDLKDHWAKHGTNRYSTLK